MHLDAKQAEAGNDALGLVVIHGLNAVQPKRDARSVGADDILVPVIAMQIRFKRGHVGGDEHAIAAGFVVERAPPGRVAEIALVAG